MKKNDTHILFVKTKTPPTVEIDASAAAIYVRFHKAKVARTIRHESAWPIVTVDLDSNGNVVGVECVGVRDFNISQLLRKAFVHAPAEAVANARIHIATAPPLSRNALSGVKR